MFARNDALLSIAKIVLTIFAATSFPGFVTASETRNRLLSIYRFTPKIGGQFYDYQNYHQIPYFHGGMDLCAPPGTEVFTPVAGFVSISKYTIKAGTNPHQFKYIRQQFQKNEHSNTRYLEIAIKADDGKLWMFRHIDPASVPDLLFDSAESGQKVLENTLIGHVAAWDRCVYPEKDNYNHIHLEILASDSTYLNPADYVLTNKDYYPPVILGIFFQMHDRDQAFSGYPRPVVSGKADIIVNAYDRMNDALYQHSVYAASWGLDRINADGSTSKIIQNRQAYKFDTLPFKGERVQLAKVIYRDFIELMGRKIAANANDGPRTFLINMTAGTPTTGYNAYNCLDTRNFSNGTYRLRVSIADKSGNIKQAYQEFVIKN
ncbi:MAG: hypothetical protein Kow0029_18470 [Candidatus Rifleibacteriota bacterium]